MLRKFALAFACLTAWSLFGQQLVSDCPSCIVVAQTTGPTYFYVATTVDANGFESGFSNQVTATFNQGQHNAMLTWTAATVPTGGAAIAGYNIYRSKTTGGPYMKVNAALITSGVTYTDSFVLPNAPTLAAPTTN